MGRLGSEEVTSHALKSSVNECWWGNRTPEPSGEWQKNVFKVTMRSQGNNFRSRFHRARFQSRPGISGNIHLQDKDIVKDFYFCFVL